MRDVKDCPIYTSETMKEHLGIREGIQDVGEKVVEKVARDRNEGSMGTMKWVMGLNTMVLFLIF